MKEKYIYCITIDTCDISKCTVDCKCKNRILNFLSRNYKQRVSKNNIVLITVISLQFCIAVSKAICFISVDHQTIRTLALLNSLKVSNKV